MKNLKILLMLFTTALLLISCKKDEQGHRISYYKNKTGEGYIFYKFEDNSIAPICNLGVEIVTYAENPQDIFSTGPYHHTDIVYTNNAGKYSFKIVKKINNQKVTDYNICPHSFSDMPLGVIPSRIIFDKDLLDNFNKFSVDTIFFYHDPISIL